MIDNYTVFIVFSTICAVSLLIGFASMLKDLYIDYMYIDIEEEILLDMLYD